MSSLIKIKAIRDSLSANENKLADYVLAHPESIRNLSSQKLAQTVGVSQSSVVKFSQKLGYKGYPDFKFALNDSLHRQNEQGQAAPLHGQISLSDSFEEMSEKLLSSEIKVLTQTKAANEQWAYEKASQLLLDAKRILICGIGSSALVAQDLSFKLQKLGMAAVAESDSHVQMANVANYGSEDLLFVISESGETREEVAVTNIARDNQVPVISLTRFANNSIAKKADCKLYTVAEEDSARLSSILAHTAQSFVLDTLFILLTQTSERGRQLLELSNDVVRQYRNR
ncbi:Glucokinase [Saliniradius amylolyticus]|uniref:Glucokinase n=1 Tax=Saliniradius amylolyticus TaxID=2183582 RepID=A0A2S2E626_9ALTE|nr:MurR/RpiR family transcriptional regulator [Saliniradius amylolyticus]AWL13106.1 Glucokinase [Saliniradius amylolyticus]